MVCFRCTIVNTLYRAENKDDNDDDDDDNNNNNNCKFEPEQTRFSVSKVEELSINFN